MHDCNTCTKTYARAEHLRRHIETTHAPDSDTSSLRDKHRCDYHGCGQSFTRGDALLRHKRIHTTWPRNHTTWQHGRDTSRRSQSGRSTGPSAGESVEISPNETSTSSHLSGQGVSDEQQSPYSAGRPGKKADNWASESTYNESQSVDHPNHSVRVDRTSLSWLEDARENELPHLMPSSSIPQWQINQQSQYEQHTRQAQSGQPYSNGHAFDLLDSLGVNAQSDMINPYFSGLDWIFDDLTDVNLPQPVLSSASAESQWPDEVPEEGGANDFDERFMPFSKTSPDTTETLNLYNLANTALHMSNTNQQKGLMNTGFRSLRLRDGISTPQREEDGESSWPQEYRPKRKNPPTIELSFFSLPTHPVKADESKSAVQGDIILIDADEEEHRSSSRWIITEETRQKLLSYLTHSCRHSWSIYSFNSSPPATFLTVPQLQKLIDLFFAKFHPFVPVIHAATFDPAKAPPVLLLIVVTIGLVFYPSENATSDGGVNSPAFVNLRKTTSILAVAFSELVRIGVCSAYEADQRGFTDVSINQAWILQQTFGIGSGDKRLNKIAERNRGGIVTAIRRIGLLYQTKESSLISDDANGDTNLQKKWHAWIAEESRMRLGWFVYLYDQTFSCYLDVAPMFRYTEVTSAMPCHADLWNAESAEVWMQRSRKVRSSASTLHGVLRQLLQPTTAMPPLHINQLEAYILSVTLYRIRWDASKEKIVFNDGSLSYGMDSAAEKAMERLSGAAAIQSSNNRGGHAIPLASDVQLFHLLAKLHFTGPPLFFDKLRDAAGRSGMSSSRRQDAITWLQEWMASDSSSQIAMRRMLLASAQIFALERKLSTRLKGAVMQSNIRTMSLFHAALSMWAYTQFAIGGKPMEGREESNTAEALPRIHTEDIMPVSKRSFFDLTGSAESFTTHANLVEAWIQGGYISTQDDKTYNWPLSPMAVFIEGIGCLLEPRFIDASADDEISQPKACLVLECFAELLARHDWGLAVSFRLILLHMARQAVK
jgi:hypothetical protein